LTLEIATSEQEEAILKLRKSIHKRKCSETQPNCSEPCGAQCSCEVVLRSGSAKWFCGAVLAQASGRTAKTAFYAGVLVKRDARSARHRYTELVPCASAGDVTPYAEPLLLGLETRRYVSLEETCACHSHALGLQGFLIPFHDKGCPVVDALGLSRFLTKPT
jgi:hypothetical protein